MTTQEHSLYPQAFGIEEELRIEKSYAGRAPIPASVDDLKDALAAYQTTVAASTPGLTYDEKYEHVYKKHTSAGDKTYVDGDNVERSTAECATIRDTILRSRGVEQFSAGMARCIMAADPDIEVISHHRRVGVFVEPIGSQDNISVPIAPAANASEHSKQIMDMLTGIAVSRPYMTGAGEYSYGQFFFSQKHARLGQFWAIHGLDVEPVQRRGEGRYEIRENDINICDATATMRLGGTAIGAALAQTTLFREFESMLQEILRDKSTRIDWIDTFNVPALHPDGSFDTAKNAHLSTAMEFNLRLAESFMSRRMQKEAGEQPKELLDIAGQIYEYTQRARGVLGNIVPLEALVPYSDWAAKHANGGPAVDYDTIAYRNTGNTVQAEKVGLGFMLRDMGIFGGDISQTEADRAYFEAPHNTRATLRGRIIRDYIAGDAQWDSLTLICDDPDGGAKPVEFYMPDPVQFEPTAEQARILKTARRR